MNALPALPAEPEPDDTETLHGINMVTVTFGVGLGTVTYTLHGNISAAHRIEWGPQFDEAGNEVRGATYGLRMAGIRSVRRSGAATMRIDVE